MFQIVSALVLDVPEAAACFKEFHGVPPNVWLPFEPWGHIEHGSSQCQRLSSDRTGTYIHALSISQSPHFISIVITTISDRQAWSSCVVPVNGVMRVPWCEGRN